MVRRKKERKIKDRRSVAKILKIILFLFRTVESTVHVCDIRGDREITEVCLARS